MTASSLLCMHNSVRKGDEPKMCLDRDPTQNFRVAGNRHTTSSKHHWNDNKWIFLQNASECLFYGTSQLNERIQFWWGILRLFIRFWISLFYELRENGHLTGTFMRRTWFIYVFPIAGKYCLNTRVGYMFSIFIRYYTKNIHRMYRTLYWNCISGLMSMRLPSMLSGVFPEQTFAFCG